VEYLF